MAPPAYGIDIVDQASAAMPMQRRPGPEEREELLQAKFDGVSNALAFTRGKEIHFAPGRLRPASSEGKRLLAHELTHAVQQREGRVPAPGAVIQRHHTVGLDDEKEADAEIYRIVRKKDKAIIYVGQTCAQVSKEKRFDQHLKDSKHSHWSKETHEVQQCEFGKEWTKLETTAAEQYWYEKYVLDGCKLENAQRPITKATFLFYKTANTFRGKGWPGEDKWTPKE